MTSRPCGQRALFHTGASKSSGASLNAPRLINATPSPNMSASVSKMGRGTKWSVVGATAIAISAAAALSLRDQQASARANKKKDLAENDARYQTLLDAYGSGESLEDLQKAVGSYESK